MVQLPGRSTQSIMAVKAEMVVVTIINILEKFDEDELALMMDDHNQDWEGHVMKSASPKSTTAGPESKSASFWQQFCCISRGISFFPAITMLLKIEL